MDETRYFAKPRLPPECAPRAPRNAVIIEQTAGVAQTRRSLPCLRVKPGITGLWQVSGRNRLTYRQMCELDVEYVRRWSLWLDFLILVKTIPVVVFNSGKAA